MKSRKIERAASFGKQPEADHGNKKTVNKNVFEIEIKSLSLGSVIHDARKFRQLTQQALALKSETTKSYISRIENSGSDIRFSTLMKIINEGLESKLVFTSKK